MPKYLSVIITFICATTNCVVFFLAHQIVSHFIVKIKDYIVIVQQEQQQRRKEEKKEKFINE